MTPEPQPANPPPTLTAEETPALQRELIEYHRTPYAAFLASLMVRIGRQPLRPPGSDARVGKIVCETEADRLDNARLWHVDADLADLVDAAYPTMPPFAPRPHDLPSRSGFVTFARPLTMMSRRPDPVDELVVDMFSEDCRGRPDAAERATVVRNLVVNDVSIVAASWGPVEESAVAFAAGSFPAGAVWMSFWSMPASVANPALLGTLERSDSPRLTVDNECVVAWHPDGTDPAPFILNHRSYNGTGRWVVALLAAFILGRQDNVGEEVEVPVPRAERRRHKHAGIREPKTVRVLRLRRRVASARSSAPPGSSGRVYRNRWMVSDHWKNVWYPTLQIHRPRWIAPYLVTPPGVPADAPLLGGHKVTVLSAGSPPKPKGTP